MPPAIQYDPTFSSEEAKQLETDYKSELLTRVTTIDLIWKYYVGNMPNPLQDDKTKVDDNILLPLIETLVNKGVSSMMGTDEDGIVQGVKFEVSKPKDAKEDPPEQKDLDLLWDANFKDEFSYNVFLQSGLAGHNFVKIIPEALEDPEGSEKMLPRFVALDPRNCGVIWDTNDVKRVLAYRIQYGKAGSRRREDIARDVAEDGTDAGTWTIYTFKELKDDKWELVGTIVWPKPWPPIVDWQNLPVPAMGGYYGRDDVGTLPKVNDAINFAVSNVQRINKHHGHPKFVVTGGGLPPDYENNPNTALEFDSPEAKAYNVEMQSEGQIAMAMLQFLQRQFYNNGREVDPATVADKLGDLTNFGLRLLYGDSVTKRQTKWMNAKRGLQLLCQRALELMGHAPNIKINVIPPAPLPQDPNEQAQALQIDVANGLSRESYLEKRGYDPEQEQVRRDKAREESVADEVAKAQANSFSQFADIGGRRNRALNGIQPERAA